MENGTIPTHPFRPRFLLSSESLLWTLFPSRPLPGKEKANGVVSGICRGEVHSHGVPRRRLYFLRYAALGSLPDSCTEPVRQEKAALRRLVPCPLPVCLNLCWRKWQAASWLQRTLTI